MNKKTTSLAYPSNPLAAMRDLQDLDFKPDFKEAPQTNSATSSVVAQQHSSEVANATSSQEVSVSTLQVASVSHGKESVSSDDSSNPMTQALWEMLGKPYMDDGKKSPFTVSTVKIPTEVWQRLDWVSTLTSQPKQEILTEALKAHFEQLLKTRI